MQTEDLQIDLFAETDEVRFRSVFIEPGGSTRTLGGFPCVALKSEMDDEPDSAKTAIFTDFVIAADNKPVAYSIKRGDAPRVEGIQEELDIKIPKWYTFRLDFAPKQHRVLTVSYRAPYGKYTETISDDEHIYAKSLTYLLSTAAIWAGPIKHGHVVIRAKSVNPDEVKIRGGKPGRFQQSAKDTWTWDFGDFKPTFSDDIAIETSPEIKSYPSTQGEGADHVDGGRYSSTADHCCVVAAIAIAGFSQALASSSQLPIYIEDSHAGSFYFLAEHLDLDRPHTFLLFDAHSDASAIFNSDAIRTAIRSADGLPTKRDLFRSWRQSGKIQCYHWIEPLIPPAVAQVICVPRYPLQPTQLFHLENECRLFLDGHEEVCPRLEKNLSRSYSVTDLTRLKAQLSALDRPEQPIVVSIDLDFFANTQDADLEPRFK